MHRRELRINQGSDLCGVFLLIALDIVRLAQSGSAGDLCAQVLRPWEC